METAGVGQILHTFVVSIGTLQMLPLILENSPFPCDIAIFLNVFWELKLFLIFLNPLTPMA